MYHRQSSVLSSTAIALFALLLVFLSGGVSVMHCAHSGNTAVVQLSTWTSRVMTMPAGEMSATCDMAQMDPQAAETTLDEPGCMDVKQWQLSTLQVDHPSSFNFHILQPLLAIDLTVQLMAVQPAPLVVKELKGAQAWHAPPRAWLQKLCTLTI